MKPSSYIPKPNVPIETRLAASALGRLAKGVKKKLTDAQRGLRRANIAKVNAKRAAKLAQVKPVCAKLTEPETPFEING